MKTKSLLLVVFFMATITLTVASQEKQDYKMLFEKAKYAMETKGNLKEAIGLFESLIKSNPDEKEIAANSQLLIGICFEKLGLQAVHSAREAFQKVLNNYPDQSKTVQLAKNRLQYLNSQTQAKNLADTKADKQFIVRKIHSDDGFYGSISPNGKYVSYVDWTKGNIAVLNLETGKKRLITDEGTWKNPNKFGDISVWSPDGKFLAYYWISDKNNQLHIQNLETGEDRILGEGIGNKCPWPMQWTNDGKYLLAAALDESETTGSLLLVSVKDGSVKKIYDLGDQCPCGGASISPDGKYVVVSQGEDLEPRDIHIFSVDGSYKNKLIDFPGADWAPMWTPDGKKVIFASKRSGSPALWIVKVTDGKKVDEPELIYEGISEIHNSLRFTNEGKFVFLSSSAYSNIFLATIKPDEGIIENPTQIAVKSTGIYEAPFWSPDGNKIAYFERNLKNNSSSGVIIHDLKTGKEKELKLGLNNIEKPGWVSPQWSKNSKELLLSYVKNNDNKGFVLVDIETENIKYLKGHSWSVFGPENTIIYVDSTWNNIIQQNIDNGEEKLLFKSNSQITNLAISQDKTTLAFFKGDMEGEGIQKDLYIMQVNNPKAKMLWKTSLNQHFPRFAGLNFFPDGKTLLLCLSTQDIENSKEQSQQFYTFNINTQEKKPLGKKLIDSDLTFDYIRLSPNGKKIAFSSGYESLDLWSLEFDF